MWAYGADTRHSAQARGYPSFDRGCGLARGVVEGGHPDRLCPGPGNTRVPAGFKGAAAAARPLNVLSSLGIGSRLGPDMELESNPLLERSVFQRLLSAMMMIALVLACLTCVTWLIRAFDFAPTITIPRLQSPIAALPAPSTQADPLSAPPQTSPAFAKAPAALPEKLSRGSMTTTTNAAADVDPATATSVPSSATTKIGAAAIAKPSPLPRRQAPVANAGPVPVPRPRPVEMRSVEETRPVEEEEEGSAPAIQPAAREHRSE